MSTVVYLETKDGRKPLGEILGLIRESQEATQEQLGRLIGCHRTLISHIESGKRPMRPEDVADLALKDNRFQVLLDVYCNRCPICEAKKQISMRRLKRVGSPKDVA